MNFKQAFKNLMIIGISAFSLTTANAMSPILTEHASQPVHQTKFKVKHFMALTKVKARVGHIENGKCKFEKSIHLGTYPITNHMSLTVDGYEVREHIGNGFTCIEISYHASHKSVHDYFELIWNDRSQTYVYSNPFYSEVKIS